jgi:hypothetical protein
VAKLSYKRVPNLTSHIQGEVSGAVMFSSVIVESVLLIRRGRKGASEDWRGRER